MTTRPVVHARWLFLCLWVLVLAAGSCRAAFAADVHGDPRLARWSEQYREGRVDAVLAAVERDLLSSQPHPYAAYVWTAIHDRRDELQKRLAGVNDPRLREALGIVPEVVLDYRQAHYGKLLERYPAADAEGMTDPWGLVFLAFAADKMDAVSDQYRYLAAALRRFPDSFQLVWMFEDLPLDDGLRSRVEKLVGAGGVLHGTAAGDYLRRYLATRPWDDLDRLAELERWIGAHPADARAWRARGAALAAKRHDAEAAEAYLKSHALFPFYSTLEVAATSLLRAGETQRARLLLDRESRVHGLDADRRQRWSAVHFAAAQRAAGDRGGARDTLKAALQRWPGSAEVLAEQAELELQDKRYPQALEYARKALDAEPASFRHQMRLSKALMKAGESSRALETITGLEAEWPSPPPSVYARHSEILAALSRGEARIAMLEQALPGFPESTWLRGEAAEALHEAGRHERAWRVLEQALEINPAYAWAADRLSEYAQALAGSPDAEARVRRWAERYPWNRRFHEQLLAVRAPAGVDDKLAFWASVSEAAPGRLWPRVKRVELLIGEERWEQARTVLAPVFSAPDVTAADAIDRYFYRAYVLAAESRHRQVDAAVLDAALQDLETYRRGHGGLYSYHVQRVQLLLALERRREAAETQLALARLAPDDTGVFHDLVADHAGELGQGVVLARGAAIVRRNPWDGEKIRSVIHKHALWRGSPIIALQLIDYVRTNGLLPEERYRDLRGLALKALGDTAAAFDDLYLRARSIGRSDRYIRWYDDTRRALLETDSRRVRLLRDAGRPTVEITLPSGEVITRVDHPVSGRTVRLSRGAAFIEADYDETGSWLRHLKASSGAEVFVTWNDDRQVQSIRTSEGETVSFSYENGRIVGSQVEGVGSVTISYDAQGELSDAEARDLAGKVDVGVLQAVWSITERLQALVRLLDKAAGNSVASLPFRDPRRDALREAFEAAYLSDDDTGTAQAALAYARYLVEHVSDDFAYVGQAAEVLEEVIDVGRASSDRALQRAAGEAALLWYRLARDNRARGLPAEEFVAWSDTLAWLRTQAETADGKRIRDWLAEIDEAPLPLFPDARWLPGSDLSNTGYWKRFDNADFLPDITPAPRATVLLERANGELVVGSDAGLSVLARGFWEWFGFDDALGRFSRDLAPGTAGVSSEVLALAETSDGVLWVGTARGLYALENGYDGPVRRWRSAGEGLPSPRVEHLLALGDRVLVGTPAGMRLASGEGLEKVSGAGAGGRITLLSPVPRDGDGFDSLLQTLYEEEEDVYGETIDTLESLGGDLSAEQTLDRFLEVFRRAPAGFEARRKAAGELLERLAPLRGRLPCDSVEGEFYLPLGEEFDYEILGLDDAAFKRASEAYDARLEPRRFIELAESIFQRAAQQAPGFVAEREALLARLRERAARLAAQREAGCFETAAVEALAVAAAPLLTVGERDMLRYGVEDDAGRIEYLHEVLSEGEFREQRIAARYRYYVERLGALRGSSVHALVGTDKRLLLFHGSGEPSTLVSEPVDAAVWFGVGRQVVFLRGTELFTVTLDQAWRAGAPKPLSGQQDLDYAKRLFGLARARSPSGEPVLLALSDRGLGFYRDWHFESMTLPFENLRNGVQTGARAVSSRGPVLSLLSHEGLYRFEHDRARQFTGMPVYDLVSDDTLGVTYVATGDGILWFDHDEPEAPLTHFSGVSARHLALDAAGNLLADDGHTIVRFERGYAQAKELFSARPTVRDDWGDGPVRSLMVDSRGIVWVAAGGSVFRWSEDNGGDVQEFSHFLDAGRFPIRTQMVSRVIETLEGKIQAIGSHESHLSYQGVAMDGGTVEFDSATGVFHRVEGIDSALLTGYTRIDDKTAIIGTTGGFFLQRAGREPEWLGQEAYPDYQRLMQKIPQLWLGRRGVKLAERSWLFPTAGGLVLYHQGRWLYPQRLNQLLPEDQKLGQYGGRTVHAVSVDSRGRVYAGTDLGLLVFDTGGSVASLLIDNGMGAQAFSDLAVAHLAEVKDVFLEAIDPESEQGRMLARYRELESDIAGLKIDADAPALSGASRKDAAPDREAARADRTRLKATLRKREKARQRLLHRLENEHYGLFQMLKLDPRELAALHRDLAPDQVVVQYLPTPRKLYIQVVTREGARIREVDVEAEQLYQRALRAASHLASDAYRLAGVPATRGLALAIDTDALLPDLDTDLAWLYERLLRPVERDIDGRQHVFVVPVGALTYLPFPALLRGTGEQAEYAVQRYAMGVLPSMFHLGLVLKQRESYVDESLLIGDPDGSLPAAREEVREVSARLPDARAPLIGTAATYEAFVEQAGESRVVHLATHGVLNQAQPQESYLLLADGYRLNVLDIASLDMAETDLVVLSACESGVGREGLEYATLARAFAHAQVPSVIASLWQVNDPATRALMSGFYERYARDNDVFTAMAEAQRAMLSGDAAWRTPAAWSGFLVFGKP